MVYGVFMLVAMKSIAKNETLYLTKQSQVSIDAARVTQEINETNYNANTPFRIAELPLMFYLSNAVFWCFAVQPMIGFSLHIPKFTPDIPVSTPFWLAALVIIFFRFQSLNAQSGPVITSSFYKLVTCAYSSAFW